MWQTQVFGDPTIADAELDRLVHGSHRIELKGESMRKLRAAKAVQLDGPPVRRA
jgi:DNA replication protein DnaC